MAKDALRTLVIAYKDLEGNEGFYIYYLIFIAYLNRYGSERPKRSV